MKFLLSTSGNFYSEEQAEELKTLGFKFTETRPEKKKNLFMPTESVEIEINTLEELVAFSEKWGNLIISPKTIEIYDDYRE